MLAVIGGSGLSQLANLDVSRREVLRTPYGQPSGALTFGQVCGHPIIFLARHGYGHTIPPHEVNYRANIWALSQCGARALVSVASVGCIRADLKPGDLVIPHQIIDYTWGRKSTYHDGSDGTVTHIDFTEPYDHLLRTQLIQAAADAQIAVQQNAVYAATQGPRLETAAEVRRYERDGADIIGMTGMPEAALARELGLPYAAISVVANYSAGHNGARAGQQNGIDFDATQALLLAAMARVRLLIERMLCRDQTCS